MRDDCIGGLWGAIDDLCLLAGSMYQCPLDIKDAAEGATRKFGLFQCSSFRSNRNGHAVDHSACSNLQARVRKLRRQNCKYRLCSWSTRSSRSGCCGWGWLPSPSSSCRFPSHSRCWAQPLPARHRHLKRTTPTKWCALMVQAMLYRPAASWRPARPATRR